METRNNDFYDTCKSELSQLYCNEYPKLVEFVRKCEMAWVNDGKPGSEKTSFINMYALQRNTVMHQREL